MPDNATILFGAFDRHNLGDLLFPHIVSALLPNIPVIHAGLTNRDMRLFGGHLIADIAELMRERDEPIDLVHVGGEILTCEAEEARSMLLLPTTRAIDARGTNEFFGPAPYVASKMLFRTPGIFAFNSIGGVALDHASAPLRDSVITSLKQADSVTVRDRYTQAALARHGIAAPLAPDSGVMTATLFGDRISQHRQAGEVARMSRAFPTGFLALQFSADFADDASLSTLAKQCDALAASTGLGVVLFRAGAAPLHDNLDLYHLVQQRMENVTRAALFESLDIWDICALIAASRGYLGSSLHGRIVALAFGLPRVTLAFDADMKPSKHRGFIDAWEDPAMPGIVPPEQSAAALLEAMTIDRSRSERQAALLVERYRADGTKWCDMIRRQN